MMKFFFYGDYTTIQSVTKTCKKACNRSIWLLITTLVFSVPVFSQSSVEPLLPAGYKKVDSTEVDAILNNLTLKEKVGQLFLNRANGDYLSVDSDDYISLERAIKDDHIGGIIFFSGNVYGQAELTNKLQQMSQIPLWIAEDMEFGPAMRIRRSTRFTPNMGVAATGNPYFAYQIGRITGYEAKAIGVDQIFAPVVDVNNNPDNPIINVRSYSENPKTVAIYGDAFMRSLLDEGIIPTAKHFPGHGDTHIDSHVALPVSPYGFARLDTVELVPFKYLIDHGLPSIMSAHIAFPKISGNPDLPGTLDPHILHDLLRDSLHFKGVVVTDALEMQGITSNYSPGEAAIMALKAGADILILSPDENTAIHDVIHAVKTGILSERRINQSVRKILRWKIEKGLFSNDLVNVSDLYERIHTRDHILLSQEIARRSVTVLKNKGNILPIIPHKYPTITVVAMSDDETGTTGTALAEAMREYHPNVIFHIYDKRTSKGDLQKIIDDARKSSLIVVGSFVYVHMASKIQLSNEQIAFVKRLDDLQKPTILIAFGNPYVIRDFPHADVQICAWSASDNQVEQTVPALFGASEVDGSLPISIPPYYKRGDGLTIPKTILRPDAPEIVNMSRDSLYTINKIMNHAIRDSVFPGGVVAVVKDGIIPYEQAFGYQTYKKLDPVKTTDIYDLASLTKVVATTASVMKLYDEGKIHLTDHVSKYFKEFRHGIKRRVTIQELLTHTSGLPADNSLKNIHKVNPKAFLKDVLVTPLAYTPGTKYVYSDLGFIILGAIVQKISGLPLNKFAEGNIYYPLDMYNTMFNPMKRGRWLLNLIPPSQIDTTYRHRLIKGEVNDERSYYMGGVAGHAGLFSSAHDLAEFAQLLLNNGSYEGQQIFKPETVKLFTQKESKVSGRGYGFDLKTPVGFSTAGQLMSDKTYGHLGFTGTSMWIDPTRKLAVIILTNRTYPHRNGSQGINKVRAEVADAVVSSILKSN